MKNVVSFSGGQTSGFMFRQLIDQHPDFRDRFEVIFCNTGREHEKTLDFVHEVETQWQIPITWLEYRRIPASEIDPEQVPEGRKRSNLLKAVEAGSDAHWFTVVDYATASRRCDYGPFDAMLKWSAALPNVQGRTCSANLKMRTSQRYLDSKQTGARNDYIGIRYDERHRATEILANSDDKLRTPMFPLVDGQFTVAHVEDFWAHNHFRLDIPNHMGNCDLCFLKAKWKRIAAAKADPQAAQWWADWEGKFEAKGVTGDGARFKKGSSYEDIISIANALPDAPITPPTKRGKRVPAEHPFLDFTEQDIPCSCAVGGYRGTEDDL